jgi:hypothetical protein
VQNITEANGAVTLRFPDRKAGPVKRGPGFGGDGFVDWHPAAIAKTANIATVLDGFIGDDVQLLDHG